VLANRSKVRVRSKKEPRDGSGWRNLIDVRGYLENLQDTRKTDLFHASPGVNLQNDQLIFYLLSWPTVGAGRPGRRR
jgi:hypothetical protein